MQVYRLARRPYATHLDGQGAALFGGRWNSVGQPVVYTARHRSLAVLEYRVNNPLPVQDLLMVTVEVPDDSLQRITQDDLPVDWARYAFESPCAQLGDQWLTQRQSLLLEVPSAVVILEHNVLINPLHPMMNQSKVLDASPFIVDARMYASPG